MVLLFHKHSPLNIHSGSPFSSKRWLFRYCAEPVLFEYITAGQCNLHKTHAQHLLTLPSPKNTLYQNTSIPVGVFLPGQFTGSPCHLHGYHGSLEVLCLVEAKVLATNRHYSRASYWSRGWTNLMHS